MNKKLLSIVYAILNCSILAMFAQTSQFDGKNLIPPSPNASAFAKYVEIPVSTYTGIPSISIPIYTIKVKDFTLPISLSYHAGGIRIEEEASWVGLGWSLNAGGCITENVVGTRDFEGGGFLSIMYTDHQLYPSTAYYPQQNAPYLDFLSRPYPWLYPDHISYTFLELKNLVGDLIQTPHDYSMMPDIYYFNFNGFSGKFLAKGYGDRDGDIFIPDKQDIKFYFDEIYKDGIYKYIWTAITPDGTQYIFDNREYTTLQGENDATISYYLGQIITNKGDTITFDYESNGTIWNINPLSESEVYKTDGFIPDGVEDHKHETSFTTYVSARRLHQITYNNGKIVFEPDTLSPRIDIKSDDNTYKLGAIKIYSKNPDNTYSLFKSFELDNSSYFEGNSAYGNYLSASSSWPANYLGKRLKLSSIVEEDANGNQLKPYLFEYYDDYTLPYKTGYAKDYWGYFNGAYNNVSDNDQYNLLPYLDQFNTSKLPALLQSETGHANRTPSEAYAKTATLSKITYPTGGYAEFYYSLNDYSNITYEKTGLTKYPGPGLRVTKTIFNDGTANTLIHNYTYGSSTSTTYGKLMSPIRFFTDFSSGFTRKACSCQGITLCCGCDEQKGLNVVTFTSSSCLPLSNSAQGSYIGYDKVVVTVGTDGANGKTEYNYINCPDIISEFTSQDSRVPTIPYHASGKLSSQIDYKYNSSTQTYDTVKKVTCQYTNNYLNYTGSRYSYQEIQAMFDNADVIWGYFIEKKIVTYQGSLYDGGFCKDKGQIYLNMYPYLAYSVLPLSKTETLINNGNRTSKTTSYIYGSKHNQPIEITETQSNNISKVTKLKYPPEYAGKSAYSDVTSLGIKNMIDNYRINEPIETYVNKGTATNVTEGTIQTFKVSGTFVVPYITYGLEIASPLSTFNASDIVSGNFTIDPNYKCKLTIDATDISMNVLQYHKEKDMNVSYLWGYNKTLPIAEAKNATKDEIYYTSYEEDADFGNLSQKFTCDRHTGEQCMVLLGGQFNSAHDFDKSLLTSGQYKYSAWVKTSGTGLNVIIKDRDHSSPWIATPVPNTNGKWQYYEVTANINSSAFNGCSMVRVEVWNDGTTAAFVDDVRFYPADAQMTTYTYKPLIGMTSQIDAKNIKTTYSYDSFGRLMKIKDNDNKILKEYKYHYANGASDGTEILPLCYGYNISCSPTSLSFSGNGGNNTVNFSYSQNCVTVSKPSWLVETASTTSYKNYHVDINPGCSNRTGNLVLQLSNNYETRQFTIPVTQGFTQLYLSYSPNSLAFGASGESKTINFTDVANKVTISKPSWLTESVGTNNSQFEASVNHTCSNRTGNIVLGLSNVCETKQVAIPVSQVNVDHTISSTPASFDFDGYEGNGTVNFTNATTTSTVSKPEWLVETASGANYKSYHAGLNPYCSDREENLILQLSNTCVTKQVTIPVLQSFIYDNMRFISPNKGENYNNGDNLNITWVACNSSGAISGCNNIKVILNYSNAPNNSQYYLYGNATTPVYNGGATSSGWTINLANLSISNSYTKNYISCSVTVKIYKDLDGSFELCKEYTSDEFTITR